MAIEQKNLYVEDRNLSNLAINVDLNAIGIDKTIVEANFGTSPATITIKVGSIIEANGNRYTVTGADYTFQMSNTTDRFIAFNGTSFYSSATAGTFANDKHGYYLGDNISRVIGWSVDESLERITNVLSNTKGMTNIDLIDETVIQEFSGATSSFKYYVIKKPILVRLEAQTDTTISITPPYQGVHSTAGEAYQTINFILKPITSSQLGFSPDGATGSGGLYLEGIIGELYSGTLTDYIEEI